VHFAVEWNQGLEDAWSDVATFVPKFLGFLAILLIGYIVAKAISKIADKALERVGFDTAVERGGIKQALAKSQYDASDIVSKVIFYGLFLLVLQMAFGVFGENPVSEMIAGVVAYIPKVFAAIVIFVIAAAIATAAKELITNSLGGLDYGNTLGTVAAIAITTVGVFAALSQLEIAPAIVNGLFYAILAVVVGSSIVAIGGGGIQPMRQRWENALRKYDQEKPRIQQQMQSTGQPELDLRAQEAQAAAAPAARRSRTTSSQQPRRRRPAQA
jgi:hypothetical protein